MSAKVLVSIKVGISLMPMYMGYSSRSITAMGLLHNF
jgi:hypothetical protein